MKKKTVAFVLAVSLASGVSFAQSNSTPSEQISYGAVSILSAPVLSVGASAKGENAVDVAASVAAMGSALIVTGIAEGSKDTVELIAKAASGAGKISVKVARSTLQGFGLSVGTTLNVVAQSTGTALVASGKVLAFIPNAAGESLLHHSRVAGASPVSQEAHE
ncbi:hypothetical protein BSFA1_29540 [Burkholderia sp. SFA1]|uniref:hypothetical protein n=1 Tax=unclassified Caballeronia TaxID=2646786 RepID=UPI001F3C0262|nr:MULTISPECIES: hypothetical protein [unclassified Caballeronia]MCE4545298.1 hypothetical protein [Caballeronia sp. PC1]MCE4570724.1 hypothetical protein [Caballeronia sp. CLC5]BBP97825.1 hypothetical protein BSFA1_29540 [Burkholderia sp. SFA1]